MDWSGVNCARWVFRTTALKNLLCPFQSVFHHQRARFSKGVHYLKGLLKIARRKRALTWLQHTQKKVLLFQESAIDVERGAPKPLRSWLTRAKHEWNLWVLKWKIISRPLTHRPLEVKLSWSQFWRKKSIRQNLSWWKWSPKVAVLTLSENVRQLRAWKQSDTNSLGINSVFYLHVNCCIVCMNLLNKIITSVKILWVSSKMPKV